MNETKLEALSKRVQRYYWPEEDEYGNSLQQPTPDDDGQWVRTDEVAGLLANLAAEKARADAAEASLRTEEIECDALWEIIGFLREDVVMQELERSEEYWLEAYEGTKPDLDMCAHGRFTKLHDLTTAIKRLDAQEGEG